MNGSNLTSLAWSSGEGLRSLANVLGTYCPGISMADEPPPTSPPIPSRDAPLAAVFAALTAALKAIVADDEVDDKFLIPKSSSVSTLSPWVEFEYRLSQAPGHRSGCVPTNIPNALDDEIRGSFLGLRETCVSNFSFQCVSFSMYCANVNFGLTESASSLDPPSPPTWKSRSKSSLYFRLNSAVFIRLSSLRPELLVLSDCWRKNLAAIRLSVLLHETTIASSSSASFLSGRVRFSKCDSARSRRADIVASNSSSYDGLKRTINSSKMASRELHNDACDRRRVDIMSSAYATDPICCCGCCCCVPPLLLAPFERSTSLRSK
mmetsp:Transcript_36166/g.86957  ORF Transcript_36166/g.86957 Transcript_36166/m.86957 type:complete len:321 (-) Transcript_36166:11396-12358(-)